MWYWIIFAEILHKLPKMAFLVEIACHFAGKQSYARVFSPKFRTNTLIYNLVELVSVIKII